MARVEIPVTLLTRAGVDINAADVASDATNNHFITMDPTAGSQLFVIVRSTSGSDQTVTFYSVTTSDFTGATRVVTVAASTRIVVGPFPRSLFSNGGTMNVDVSVSTNLKLSAYVMPGEPFSG